MLLWLGQPADWSQLLLAVFSHPAASGDAEDYCSASPAGILEACKEYDIGILQYTLQRLILTNLIESWPRVQRKESDLQRIDLHIHFVWKGHTHMFFTPNAKPAP